MIEVNRNSMVIRNVDTEGKDFKSLEKGLSLYDPVTHRYEFHLYTLIESDIYMPSSIGPEELQKYFPKELITYNYLNTVKAKEISFQMKTEPRDDIQREALTFLKRMKTDNIKERLLSLETGKGKTFVSIATICYLRQRALIVADTVDLANQWKEQFLKHTTLTEDEIVILSGRDSVDKAKSNSDVKIYIAIHNTLNMILSDGNNDLNSLLHKLQIGVKVFDEAHVNFGNICKIQSLTNTNYTIYLTATPNRSNYKEDFLFRKMFNKIPKFDANKSITKERYHKVVMCKFNSHPNDKMQIKVKTKYGFSLNRWAGYLTEDIQFKYYFATLNEIITKFKLIDRNIKVAIMLPTISLIEKTKEKLLELYPTLDLGVFIGEVNKKERASELNKLVILTNHKIFGKALDVPDLSVIINFVQLNSKVVLEQMIGRLRNNSGNANLFFDVTDTGYIYTRNMRTTRKRIFKKLVKEILEVDQEFGKDL